MPHLDARFDEFFSAAVRTERLAGIVVGITRHGAPLYARAFGTADAETDTPATLETLFHMASVTKGFVSVAVMHLVERGGLRLDGPVVNYLPYFRLREIESRRITIGQLLRHTAGVPHPPNVESYHWHEPEYDEGALERHVRSLSSMSMVSAPAERFAYSDIGFDILGDVIAKVARMPFEAYMREYVLLPLGMSSSTLCAPRDAGGALAQPHVLNEHGEPTVSRVYPYHRAHSPSSTLASNVPDMNRSAISHLGRGRPGRPAILSTPSYEQMWQPVVQVNARTWMGLGWFGRNSGDALHVFLNGTDHGFATHFALYPGLALSIVLMSNSDWAKPWKLAASAVDLLFAADSPGPVTGE